MMIASTPNVNPSVTSAWQTLRSNFAVAEPTPEEQADLHRRAEQRTFSPAANKFKQDKISDLSLLGDPATNLVRSQSKQPQVCNQLEKVAGEERKLAFADFSIVTMEKRTCLVFGEPRSIGKCGTEVEIMSKFSYKSSRTKKWNYRILISTAVLTNWPPPAQRRQRRRTSTRSRQRDLHRLRNFHRRASIEHLEISSDSQANRSTPHQNKSTKTPERLNAYNRSFISDMHEAVSDDRSRDRIAFEARTHRSRRKGKTTRTQRNKIGDNGIIEATTSREQESAIAVL
ncbi:hypothetical protein Bca4012_025077 [Brassica carinata]